MSLNFLLHCHLVSRFLLGRNVVFGGLALPIPNSTADPHDFMHRYRLLEDCALGSPIYRTRSALLLERPILNAHNPMQCVSDDKRCWVGIVRDGDLRKQERVMQTDTTIAELLQ